jgi:hypothetical protein
LRPRGAEQLVERVVGDSVVIQRRTLKVSIKRLPRFYQLQAPLGKPFAPR